MAAWIEQQYEIPVDVVPRVAVAPSIVPECAFCDARPVEYTPNVRFFYPVWKCPCGAIGSGAWLPDLDEVGDQLLEILGIDARVSQPCMPTDHPATSIQRCDASKVQEDMAEILKLHGFEFRVGFRNDPDESIHYSGMRQYWVRRSEPQSRYE